MTVEFGDVVETRYVTSEEQLRRSQFGFSPVFFSGNPIVYTPGGRCTPSLRIRRNYLP
jgi:hypothetical protein